MKRGRKGAQGREVSPAVVMVKAWGWLAKSRTETQSRTAQRKAENDLGRWCECNKRKNKEHETTIWEELEQLSFMVHKSGI